MPGVADKADPEGEQAEQTGQDMPLTDDEKKRVLDCESNIAALRLLQARKSHLAVKAAHWKNIYQAQLETAHLEKKIADIDSARKKVIIVAVSGAASCCASFVVAASLARAGGYAYTSFSMAAPIVGNTVTAGGFTIATAVPLTQSVTSHILQTAFKIGVFGVPTGYVLKRTVGDNLLGLVWDWVTEKAGYRATTPYSAEDFAKLKDTLTADSIGDERFRKLMQDPNARNEQLKDAMKQLLQEWVAQHIAETLMSVSTPLNMLFLMTENELATWYGGFREALSKHLQTEYANWSREDRAILSNNLLWDFWNEISAELNRLDMKWDQDVKLLRRAVNDTLFSMSRLLGGQQQVASPR
jgi:hypothetical protein